MKLLEKLNENKLTLIVSLPSNDYKLAEAAWEAGADSVKIHINVNHTASKNNFGTLKEELNSIKKIVETAKGPLGIVLGADLEEVDREDLVYIEENFDFISLYAHHTPLNLLKNPKFDKMIAVNDEYTINQISLIESIGADIIEASVMKAESYGTRLSAKELLIYHEICNSSSLPKVLPTQRFIKPSEVELLQKCGFNGLMLGAIVTGNTVESLYESVKEFSDRIRSL